jgi:phosphatidylserine/phosphatidylglycerophosphate/cardiolipin synthase-like enzyme
LHESGVQALKAAGVPVVDDQRDGSLMHNKFMVFDSQSVWTGSMNFTENCAYRNNNHGLFIDDARIAANYATKFSWMFEQRKFGGLPAKTAKIPNPVVTLSDGTMIENYFSTHDHCADHVIEKLGQARSSIHFLAFSFTHDNIALAMLNRASAGVPVQGVFEKSQAGSSYSEYNRLRMGGPKVEVYLDANSRNMHHKVIILDGETTVAGSFNFSDGADKSNDENVVIVRSKDVAKRFEEEFQRVYGAAKKAEASGALVGAR